MITVFHPWKYGRFTEIKSNLRRETLHRTNQGSNFIGGSFSNRDNVMAPIQLEETVNSSIFKDDFSSKTDPSLFTSIAKVLLNWSNKTNRVFPALKSASHFLPQSTVSLRSDSSSAANSSCYHRSDPQSHLE